jgi:predicted GIY-YIG superfamily endonuclease
VLIDDRLDRDLDTIASGLHSNTTQANYHQLREELMAMLSRDDAEVTEVRRDRALSLLQKLDQDERELMRKLETWQQEIVTLSDRSQIGNLISDLSRHKDRYITSDDRQTVETLWSDVNTLLNFPFSNVEKLRELHEVDRVTGDLKSWYETHEVTRSSLQQHFQDLSTRLTAQRDRIKARHERTADSWLQLLQDKLTQVYAALSETERFSSTVDLLKCHKEERPQHEPYLKPDQIQTLTQLVRQARIEQNKLTALQIELGFKKLPKVQRIELYEKLAQYLDHPDES